MVYRFLLSPSLALGALFGCDQSTSPSPATDSPTQPTTELAGALPRQLPWKESYRAAGNITTGSPCPAPLLLVTLHGGGTATHVGRYTIVNSHCVDPSTGALTNGTFVKTAANGDQIFGTYVGNSTVIQPPPIAIFGVTGSLSFTGGTGRFVGATGTASMEGTLRADFSQSEVPTQVTLTMVGHISSPGLARH